jgi:hypothetical protein
MGGRGFCRRKPKLESYTLCHVGADGVVRTLEVQAKCQTEALRKFNVFLNILNLYHAGASDEQVLQVVKENSNNNGGEP